MVGEVVLDWSGEGQQVKLRIKGSLLVGRINY